MNSCITTNQINWIKLKIPRKAKLTGTEEKPEYWNRPITSKESGLVIKNEQITKKPDPEGFIYEFCQIFKE